MRQILKYAVAVAFVAVLAQRALASSLTCTKTVNSLPSLTLDQFPASMTWELTVTEASCAACAKYAQETGNADCLSWCGSSVLLNETDPILATLTGKPIWWTYPSSIDPTYAEQVLRPNHQFFWLFNGESVTTEVPLTIASYTDCALKGASVGFPADAGGTVKITDTYRVEWNLDGFPPGYAECTADLVCQPPLGPTRTIGYFKTHPAAVEACLAGGAVNLGYVVVGDATTALGVLSANPGKYDNGTKRSSLDQARLLLARQLLVAICNGRVFGSEPADAALAGNAEAALAGTSCSSMNWLQGQLDAFNNSGDTGEIWYGSATPATYPDPTPRTGLGCK